MSLILNRFQLTEELIIRGHESGGLTLTAPLLDRETIEAEAWRLGEKGQPRFDRVRNVSSAAIAVRHRSDIPHMYRNLLDDPNFTLAEQPFDLFEFPTAEGFSWMCLHQSDSETGHIGEMQLHTLDMLQARDLGIGGHLSAQQYHQQLLTLPSLISQRSTDQQHQWNFLWGKVRHLFLLALQAEKERVPHIETDEEVLDWYADRLYLISRTIASRDLFNAKGEPVCLDNEATAASDFSGMEWPRTYISPENGALGQDSENAMIVQLDTGETPASPEFHPADLLWCGLADKKETLNLREDAERKREGLPPSQRARLHLADDGYMAGIIEDGHFITHDTVYNGCSYFDLTGHRPQYKPMALSKIKKQKYRIEYL
jgi:hypothetical protein